MATGDKYLDSGKLYVAKFNADGTGQWVELSIANPTIAGYAGYAFADQADVLRQRAPGRRRRRRHQDGPARVVRASIRPPARSTSR